jgi:hypothetical protein
MGCALFEVRTEFLNVIQMSFISKELIQHSNPRPRVSYYIHNFETVTCAK